MNRCTRFTATGTAYTNPTEHVDGWYRQEGFRVPYAVTPQPRHHPAEHHRAPYRTSAPPAPQTPVLTSTNLSISGSPGEHWTDSASTTRKNNAAAAQHARRLSARGLEHSHRKPLRARVPTRATVMVLSPNRPAVTGILNRAPRAPANRSNKDAVSLSPLHYAHNVLHPTPGSPVPAEQFTEVFDAATVHVTGHAQRSYTRLTVVVAGGTVGIWALPACGNHPHPRGPSRPCSHQINHAKPRRRPRRRPLFFPTTGIPGACADSPTHTAHPVLYPNPLVLLYQGLCPSGEITERAHVQANRTRHRPRSAPELSSEQPRNSSNASPYCARWSVSTAPKL